MQKKRNKKVKFVVIICALIISMSVVIFYINKINKSNKNSKIIAEKHISREDEEERNIRYTIKFKNYEIDNIQKEIIFKNDEIAELEYTRYETINKYEKEKLEIELKGKKIIIIMKEEQFKEDIEYSDEDRLIMPFQDGSLKQIIDQEYLKELLQQQGYEIK